MQDWPWLDWQRASLPCRIPVQAWTLGHPVNSVQVRPPVTQSERPITEDRTQEAVDLVLSGNSEVVDFSTDPRTRPL